MGCELRPGPSWVRRGCAPSGDVPSVSSPKWVSAFPATGEGVALELRDLGGGGLDAELAERRGAQLLEAWRKPDLGSESLWPPRRGPDRIPAPRGTVRGKASLEMK